MSKSLNRLYQLGSKESEITLVIEFGQKQRGVTTVMLNDQILANNEEDNIKLVIGKGEELKDKTIYCTSTVKSVAEDSNLTSTSYYLFGGVISLRETLEEISANKNEMVIYTAEFFFY